MSDPRETPRRTIAADVQLKRSVAANYTVHAYDLSERGCKVEIIERPRLGETVWVKFKGLEIMRATVRWTKGADAGLEFERPIDPRVLEWLLSQLR